MMSKKSPQLRFEGFTDDWEERKLGDYVIDYVEKTTIQNQYPVLTSSQQQGIVLQETYFANRQVTTDNNIGYYVLPRGYFTFRSRSDNDIFVFNRNDLIDNGIISYFYPVFTLKNSDSDFFLKRINNGIQRQLSIQAEGTGQHVLSLKKFKNIISMFPSLKEQQKIGLFFKQLDNTIALHQRKLDLLKEQKKGYLQKMFPKNGEKVPELRFEGFTDAWEERKLGEMLVNLEAGVSVNSSDYDTGYFILKTSAIKMGNIDLFEVKSIVSEEVARAKTPLIKNSIIISRMNTPELVGASGLVRESIDNIFLPDRLWQGQVAGNFSPEWLIQSINIAANIKKIRDLATGTSGSMKNISKKSMLDLIINVPTLEEQQKIGSFFKQLDDVIALHQLKLDLLKEQKKGFLQKMFA